MHLKRQLRENISGNHTNTFKAVRADIYRNPEKYISVDDMAKQTYLSRSRFSVLYKKLFLVSPNNDLINARIAKASYLLSVETLTLTEIAEECGYQSVYHFIRQFHSVMGTTPGKYKKINR